MKNIKSKLVLKVFALSMISVLLLTTSVFAAHFRGTFSRNVGYGNLPAYSDNVYKVVTDGNWMFKVNSNPSISEMNYAIVNSNKETRGASRNTSGTGTIYRLSSSGSAGHYYKLRVKKTSSNPLKAYTIQADWDPDAN